MPSSKRTLALMVAAAPGQPGFRHAAGIARAALTQGVGVYLYCIDDAVAGIDDSALQSMAGSGLNLYVCAYSLQRRHLPMSQNAIPAGLAMLSKLIADTDRFVAFT